MTNLSLVDEVLVLSAQVEHLLERLADNPALGERPVNWAALDSDRAAEHWGLLPDWTEWLRNRHSVDERIPPCWYAHPSSKNSPLPAPPGSARTSTPKHAPTTAPPGTSSSTADCTASTAGTAPACADGTQRPDRQLGDDTDHSHRELTIRADLAAGEAHFARKRDTDIGRDPSCSSPRPRNQGAGPSAVRRKTDPGSHLTAAPQTKPPSLSSAMPRPTAMQLTLGARVLRCPRSSSSRCAEQGSWRSLWRLARAPVKKGQSRVPAQPRPSATSTAHGRPGDS